MASASDITVVRNNVNEPNADTYTDEYIGGLIDAVGVTGATVTIWEQKVAKFSTLVDVTEAGATHKFSDMFDNAVKMVTYWKGVFGSEQTVSPDGALRVRVIERSGP